METKRLPFRRELRWLIASKLIRWAFGLIEEEASVETLKSFIALGEAMVKDPAELHGETAEKAA